MHYDINLFIYILPPENGAPPPFFDQMTNEREVTLLA